MDAANPVFNEAAQGPERMQERLYHDLLAPDEVARVRAEVRAFAQAHVAPRAWDIGHTEEAQDAFAWDVFRAMGKAGLFEIPFAAEQGGRGLAFRTAATAVAIEELAYVSNSIAAVYDVHCILAGYALEQASPNPSSPATWWAASRRPNRRPARISPWAPWRPGSRRTVSTSP